MQRVIRYSLVPASCQQAAAPDRQKKAARAAAVAVSSNEIGKAVLVLSLPKLVQRTMHRVI
jgi:hypothetical protein